MPGPLGIVASSVNISSGVPATIPDLILWLDADDASKFVYGTGAQVYSWADKAVNAPYPTFYQSDTSRQPTRVLGSLIAGRYATDWVTGRLHSPRTPNTKPFTAFVALRPSTDATYRAVLASNDAGGMEWRISNAHRQSLVQEYVAEIGQSTTPLPTNTASVLCVTYSATGQFTFYINGSVDGTGTNDKPFNATAWQIVGDGIGEQFKGSIGEMLQYARVLTATERNTIFAYLAQRWRGGYLDGNVGMASIPDPGMLPADFTFVAKVMGPSNPTVAGDIMCQHDGSTNSSWGFQRYLSGSEPRLRTAVISASQSSSTRFCQGPPITGAVDYIALSNRNSGASWQTKTFSSPDEGKTWTQLFTNENAGAVDTLRDSAFVVSVGRRLNGTSIFAGRVYWVEARSGLDPAGGTVLWRFDANEHTSGTTWTDPRGKVWTLSTAAAIVH